MPRALRTLVDLLDLERIEHRAFRGRCGDSPVPRVFGGQLAAQALVAAGNTVPGGRQVHSFHAYFLRLGDSAAPIAYTVDHLRDGRSFTTRQVVAVQHGRPVLRLTASFHAHEEGLEHQAGMPSVPGPEALPTAADLLSRHADALRVPGVVEWMRQIHEVVDMRYVGTPPFGAVGAPREPRSRVWFRTTGELADDPLLHACLAAYASDATVLDPVLLAHGLGGWVTGDIVGASLDHAMWFHRPFRADEWLLYDQESPSASGGRGFGQARIFTRDGRLAASVTQEGMIRKR